MCVFIVPGSEYKIALFLPVPFEGLMDNCTANDRTSFGVSGEDFFRIFEIEVKA